jgi:nitroimidazol reductase NimA-like FMN-containing flavoprotein (pyridoxamine 5'-phosphate oxidase superfamily)
MYSDGSALEQMSRDECLALMASMPVGRIIYTRRAMPAVEVVNFALDHGDIVVRTARDGKLAAAARGAVVAFEADSLDLAQRTGWSVTAIGQAHEVTDAGEVARLGTIGLNSWAPGTRDLFIRISPVILTGRHLHTDRTQRPSGPDDPGADAGRG